MMRPMMWRAPTWLMAVTLVTSALAATACDETTVGVGGQADAATGGGDDASVAGNDASAGADGTMVGEDGASATDVVPGTDAATGDDAAGTDANVADGATTDVPTVDAATVDAQTADVPLTDAQAADVQVADGAQADTAQADTAQTDTTQADTAQADTAQADAPLNDAAQTDAALIDAATVDAGQPDAASTDAGGADASADVQDPYDPDYIPKFDLVVDDAAMATLMDTSDATKKTWVHAAFTCDGETIADVGLRRKGESTYRAIPKKAAFKIKFNKYVQGQEWRGYKELTLNNMVDDATGLRERLAYTFYGLMGLPASRCNTALVTLNGEAYGPYANVETPDTQFVKKKFGANASTLYEVDWGSEWLPGSEDGMLVDVGPTTKLDLIALFDAVQAATDANLLVDLTMNLDITEWLTFSAVEAVLAEHDNYGFGVWGSHNYYMAGGLDGLLRLVPWSVDLSFQDSDGGVDASMPLPADPGGADTVLMRCKNTVTCWAQYKAAVATVLTGYQTTDLAGLAKKWHAQIDAYQKADTKRESSLTYYQESVDALYLWIDARPGIVKTQLNLP